MVAKKTEAVVSADVDALDPASSTITLSTGLVVDVDRLKTRGMFKLLKIVTRGAGPILMQMPLDFNDNEAFVQQLLAVVVMAVPEAENEAIEFIQAMVTPEGFITRPRSEADKKKNKELIERLIDELEDPEIEDTLAIIETIVRNEAGDIQALGKRLASTLQTITPKA